MDERRTAVQNNGLKGTIRRNMEANTEQSFADFSGSWKMKSSENFEELLKALGEFSRLVIIIKVISNITT